VAKVARATAFAGNAEDNPLAGGRSLGRVLVTGPRQYLDRLAGAMIQYRMDPIHIPSLVIQSLTNPEDIERRDASLELLSSDCRETELVIFPSKNAMFGCIESFDDMDSFRTFWNGGHVENVELWAMGADADFLAGDLGISNVRKATRPSTRGIVDDLKKERNGRKALVYVPKVVEPLLEPPVVPDFLRDLKSIGVEPLAIPAYETRIGERDACKIEVELLFSGAIKAIAFSSQAEVQALLMVAGGRDAVTRCIEEHGIIVAAHGETTAEGIRAGLPDIPIVVSGDSSTFTGMAKALAETLLR
jgi:uroporphyrinogen-III synthase